MERQVDVAHLAGSSILLIHPGSEDPQRNAAGRDGDLTGLIRPKISGQYGALRLGPGRSPRMVLSTIRVGVSTRGPNDLALWPKRKRQLVQTQRVHVRIVSGVPRR
jgi:hypothetical protein